MMSHKFSKEERLCSKKNIDGLFLNGSSFKAYPFIVHFIETTGTAQKYPLQVLITVRKKNHKKAVTRNLLKRRIREAYRLNNDQIYEFLKESKKSYHLALVYFANEIHDYNQVEKSIGSVFKKLTLKIRE